MAAVRNLRGRLFFFRLVLEACEIGMSEREIGLDALELELELLDFEFSSEGTIFPTSAAGGEVAATNSLLVK